MATIESLLNLESDDWAAIAKMTDAELMIYLKDITNLEPEYIINPERQIVGRKDQDSDDDNDDDSIVEKPLKKVKLESNVNPFTKIKKTKLASKYRKEQAELDELRKELGL